MIAVIVSAISVVVIVAVTVVLINQNHKLASEQKIQYRKLVNDFNTANTENTQIDNTQNTTLRDLSTTSVSYGSNITGIQASLCNMQKKVISNSGVFNNVQLTSNFVFSPKSNYMNLDIIPTNVPRGLLMDDVLSFNIDTSNNASISHTTNGRLRLYTGTNPVDSGVHITSNSVGIGTVPRYSGTLQVNGAVWTRGGLFTSLGASLDTLAPVVTNDQNAIYINSNMQFKDGIRAGHRVTLNSNANSWAVHTSSPNSFTVDSQRANATGSYRFMDNGRLIIQGNNNSGGLSVQTGVDGNGAPLYTVLNGTGNSNLFRGSTTFASGIGVNGPINVLAQEGLLFERSGSTPGERFGIGENANSMRMYTSATGSLALSKVNAAGGFVDLISAQNNGVLSLNSKTDINGNTLINGNMNVNGVASIQNNQNNTWFMSANNPNGDINFMYSQNGRMPTYIPTESIKFGPNGTLTTAKMCVNSDCLTSSDIETTKSLLSGSQPSLKVEKNLCIGNLCLTEADIQKVKELSQSYSNVTIQRL